MKPWGIGAWAAEAEREEAEEKERAAAAAAAAPADSMEAFPTLGESVSMKPKKKKPQRTLTLAELTIGKPVAPGSRSRAISDSRGLTADEMMMLPTGPRDRSGEEDERAGLGGAFRDYRDYNRGDRDQNRGGYGGGGGFERDREGSGFLRDRERDEPSRADDSSDWSSSKKPAFATGFDGERRGSRFSDRGPPLPSRADEAGNWGLAKRSLPLTGPDARAGGRREFFADDNKRQSRADEEDNWASSKKPLPPPVPRLSGSSGQDVHSRADDADNWSSVKMPIPLETKRDSHVQDRGADSEGRWGRRTDYQQLEGTGQPQRRPVLIAPRSLQSSPPRPASVGVENKDGSDEAPMQASKIKSNPFGSARPREDILSERGTDLPRSGERDNDSRPSSSHSSRPDISESVQEPIAQAKPKVNPFGSAKPREVLLQERGKDWRKMDFDYEHRGVDRPETEEEMLLKEDIKRLTKLSNQDREASAQQMNGVLADHIVDNEAILEELHTRERQLQTLIQTLDDKVRFSQKVGNRPGSRSGRSDLGRSYDMPDRPGSRPGSRAGSRPGSRSGRSDAGWNQDTLERPGSQSGRRNPDSSESPQSHSGYGGGRAMERPSDRWVRGGQFEGSRNQEGLDRMGSWAGSSESGRSFDSLQRPRRRGVGLPTEVGGAPEYTQAEGSADVWTRSNDRDRQGSWGARERGHNQAGTRKF